MHAAFALLLGVAAVLRLFGRGWLPSRAGDEGNPSLAAASIAAS